MSTRSQLRFVQRGDQDDEPNDSDRVAQVYRRSDGYPTSVLQDLIRLKELLDATHAEREPAYTAAAFVFLDKLRGPTDEAFERATWQFHSPRARARRAGR